MGTLTGARSGTNLLKPVNLKRNQLNILTDDGSSLIMPCSTHVEAICCRVTEIQGLANLSDIQSCGKTNPADLPTRGPECQEPHPKIAVVE